MFANSNHHKSLSLYYYDGWDALETSNAGLHTMPKNHNQKQKTTSELRTNTRPVSTRLTEAITGK